MALRCRLADDVAQDSLVRRLERSCQSEAHEVSAQRMGKAVLMVQKRCLEALDVVKGFLPKQGAFHVHLATIRILISPSTDGAVIFEGKSERVDFLMTTSALCLFPVCLKSFANGLAMCLHRFLFG